MTIVEGGAPFGGGPTAEALRATAKDIGFEPGERAVGATLTVTWQLAERLR